MMGRWVAVVMMVGAASPAFADDDYRYGRIRYTEAGVTIQRGSESVSEAAEPNLPLLPGDRVWTDDAGRAEFQFGDGTVVRLDGRSKLEYMSAEDGQPNVLRLHAGSLILHAWSADPGFDVETPGGIVGTSDRGVYRIDAAGDEVTLSVYEGEASLASGRRRVRVGEGERSYARRGDEPEDPRRFDRRSQDEFARWDEDREGRASWASERRQYIPDEVEPYAGELESHGSWYYQAEAGYVWRPYVASGWQPYCHGRWAWTAYGWTWIPQETWGWAPFHYGRWDYAASLGWYWIPGRSWGPAWVHWAVGPNYVGWCPRGYRDRVVPYSERGYRGTAVATRGSGAWQYSRRDQLGLAARRPVPTAAAVSEVRVIDAPHARPGRDFRPVETAATRPTFRNASTAGAGAAVRLKPTVGDTVPELRDDNSTTIPRPVVRRHRPVDYSPRVNDSATTSNRNTRPASASAPRGAQAKPQPRDTSFSGVDPEVRSQPRRSSHDYDRPERPGSSAGASRPRGDAPPRRRYAEPSVGADRPDRSEAHTRQGNTRPADADREDVLRRMFTPLTDTPRERQAGSSDARARGSESRPRPAETRPAESRPSSHRSEPRATSGSRSEPRPAPASRGASSRSQGQGEKHPPKEKH